jgi:hypothetical protein
MASMSATRSFISSRNPRQASVGLLLLLLMAPFLCLAQVVPVQANLDAQAQRRIQEQSEGVRRQRQIDANLEKIATALSSKNLTSPEGPAFTRRALAALFDLQSEGWSPEKSLREANRLPSTAETPKATSIAYLTKCWQEFSPSITPTVATTLRAGLTPAFSIPPYVP